MIHPVDGWQTPAVRFFAQKEGIPADSGETYPHYDHEVKPMPTLRDMTNADLLAYKQLCSICYTYTDTDKPAELPADKLRIRRGVFGEDGRLLSAMMQIPYHVRFCGQTVPLAGIGGVVTDPSARAEGHVRHIFEQDLPRLHREGHVFSALYPFSHRFYGKFGYAWAEFWRNVEIPRGAIRADLNRAERIVRVLPGESDGGMAAIYEQYAADKDLIVLRDAEMWTELRNGTPWDSLKHAYVLHVGGKPAAYWIGTMHKEGYVCTLWIKELAWTSRAGLEAVFAMLRGMNELESIRLRIQGGFDPRLLVNEPYDVGWKGTTEGMVRVVNVQRALALLPAPPLPGALTIEVQDEQIGENCGKFTVNSDGYTITVEKDGRSQADLRCDIRGLTALVTGRHRFADTVDAGLAELLNPKKKRFADMLFTKRALHMNQDF